MMQKIVSGGQTGVDRAALDAAIAADISHGGWCPRGRLAEDGRIPDTYQLQETDSPEYGERTEQNVIDSDATLILYFESMSGGTALTHKLARKHHKECLCVDLSEPVATPQIADWIATRQIHVLNVAGPRESGCRGIGNFTRQLLLDVFRQVQSACAE